MSGRRNEISAFEAKTHLSELLRETERGRSFVIRRRGKAVARLGPPEPEGGADPVEVVDALHKIRERISEPVNIRELIADGRRR